MANDEGEIVEHRGVADDEQSTKAASVKGEDDPDEEKKSTLQKLKSMKFRAKTKVAAGRWVFLFLIL